MGISLKSDLGPVYATAIQGSRNQQQDAVRLRWLANDRAWLIVLADGMGGHAAGDLASKIAVDSFVGTFAAAREEGTGLEAAFKRALEDANAKIGEVQTMRPETKGMGTTLVAAHISGEGLRWVSVGDSLLMLCHDGSVTRLNEDHSLRALNVEARRGASANMLTSALMGGDIHKADLRLEPTLIRRGDVVITASDGMLTLPDEQIADVLASVQPADVSAMTEALIEQVQLKELPRQDNCTIAIFAMPKRGRGWRRWAGWLGIVVVLGAAAAVAAHYYHP